MIKFLYPTETCTLYSHYDVLNTGADEIIEVASDFTPTSGPMTARSLIKFSNEDIFSNFSPTNRYTLNLKIVQSMELADQVEIEVFPVSESWDNGKGRFSDREVIYPGASWSYRNEEKETWSSVTPSEYDSGGGSWFHKYHDNLLDKEHTIDIIHRFEKNTSDVSLDITELVNFWNTSMIENNGLILKFKDDTKKRCGNLKFFSTNTNTIYRPHLEVGVYDFKFDPYEYTTDSVNFNESGSLDSGSFDSGSLDSGSLDSGSLDSGSLDSGSLDTPSDNQLPKLPKNLAEVTSKDLVLFVEDINESYSKKDIQRMNVGVREKFPKKKFTNKMRYASSNITKNDIYYSVVDAETEEVVIDYSNFTKISCDKDGHFFKFNFNCLSRGRLYKFIIKLESDGTTRQFDEKRTFMVLN